MIAPKIQVCDCIVTIPSPRKRTPPSIPTNPTPRNRTPRARQLRSFHLSVIKSIHKMKTQANSLFLREMVSLFFFIVPSLPFVFIRSKRVYSFLDSTLIAFPEPGNGEGQRKRAMKHTHPALSPNLLSKAKRTGHYSFLTFVLRDALSIRPISQSPSPTATAAR